MISSAAARQAAQSLALDMSRGVGKIYQMGAPTLEAAIEAYLSRPKLRSERAKAGLRSQLKKHLGDWLRLSIDQITKGMVVARHAEFHAIPSAANHMRDRHWMLCDRPCRRYVTHWGCASMMRRP